ncbi:hypothetical protein D3C76_1089560 [compost metagenome]
MTIISAYLALECRNSRSAKNMVFTPSNLYKLSLEDEYERRMNNKLQIRKSDSKGRSFS